MIHFVDNFLDSDLFYELQDKMYNTIKPEQHHGERRIKKSPWFVGEPLRVVVSNIKKVDTIHDKLGTVAVPVMEKIKNYCLDTLRLSNIQAHNIWYQYSMLEKEVVGKHYDAALGNHSKNQSYTCFIYTHKVWNDDWGGEICFQSQTILPKPNRLVFYSRNKLHWVNKSKHNLENFQRMAIGIDWSRDYDIQ